MLFSPTAVGGPLKPARKVNPVKGILKPIPAKSTPTDAPIRPVKALVWSKLALSAFLWPPEPSTKDPAREESASATVLAETPGSVEQDGASAEPPRRRRGKPHVR
jgi:hypothetical protein